MHILRNGKLFRLNRIGKIDYRNITSIPKPCIGRLELLEDKCSSLNQPFNWIKLFLLKAVKIRSYFDKHYKIDHLMQKVSLKANTTRIFKNICVVPFTRSFRTKIKVSW